MWPLLVILAFLASATHGFIDDGYRIVGGHPFNGTAVSYHISLRLKQYNYHVCGGALVAVSWAITAGHCAASSMFGPLEIVAGALKLSEPGERYDVAEIVVHPKFNNATLLNDLALLKTAEPVTLSEKVYPIQLAPKDFFVGPGIWLKLVGWGLTKFPNGTAPDHVHYIRLRSITNAECKARYFGTGVPPINISQLCTYNKLNEGSCRGDSGGPLVSQNILMALISYGVPCGEGYPDVHTRIAYHRDWIDEVLKKDQEDVESSEESSSESDSDSDGTSEEGVEVVSQETNE